ncbi:ATPase [Capronia epimyces CBS 606.96]|uniref:ATPase n=1 Tax=Capronia epimyces CBS 606.96 TaxID=1182542 RepID=W9ZAB7_9EURO|nr:ATPase [Capronia epimyces CBS 606.96]EXJ91459.1 ATPase [Capronia epimyces CBS 606.96]
MAEKPVESEPKGLEPEADDSSSTPAHDDIWSDKNGGADIEAEGRAQVARLARQVTNASISSQAGTVNPFAGNTDPRLDPNSGKFSAEAWVRNMVKIVSRDPERFPRRTAGVSYRNLNVHGWGTPTDYQKDVANVLLEGPALFNRLRGKGQRKIRILQDFDGLAKSGELLVVLGRPGRQDHHPSSPVRNCGCSTLLKTIAGKTHGFYVDEASTINYQGIPKEVMHKHFRGEVIYQAETDVHFPQLTVGQTLLFAARARAPRNRLPGVTRNQYAQHMRDVIMAVFGISHTINTKVGNDFIRGVSGGERKRVSIAEVALSGSPLQCWDNATRGLDSATALEFVKTLKLSTGLAGATAIVAIYQASQSAYDLFDKVVLLYEGRQIYFGPTTHAKKYFTDMGFICADRQTTADFLTSLTNPAERIIAEGYHDRVPHTPAEFAARWRDSESRQHLLREIADFEAAYPFGGDSLEQFKLSRKANQAKHMTVKSPYTISIPMQIRLCMSRGFQRQRGDLTILFTTVFGNLLMGIITSSVFYNLPDSTSSFYSRGALLFFAVLFAAMQSALEILALFVQRPIVEKHNDYALYHPFAEAVASMMVDLPTKVVVSVSFNLVLYFMTNLRRTPGHFFVYLLFSFVTTLAMSSIFRTIASISRTLSQALAPAAIFILAIVIYAGFALPTPNMHPWFRWINYINPIAYTFESMMVNEFHDRRFPCSIYVPTGPAYTNASGLERVCQANGARAGQDFVNGDDYLNGSLRYYNSHLWRNLGIIIAFWIAFTLTYLAGTELVTSSRSKGEVLVFRRGHLPPQVKESNDEESGLTEPVGRHPVGDPKHELDDEKEGQTAIIKQTATFHWRNVCYDIKIKGEDRRILDHVDGWVRPGTLTALMGATGAGKTTLLDVLASRVTMGVVTGDMMVDGHLRDNSFQRKTGYVQQQDLHLQTATVREALRFSALLRQPKSTPLKEKLDYVEEVIKLLEMEDYAGAVVGVPGEGLNVEQRKRLTIGVELAAKPQLLLFLDEPTSGLDSQTAWSILSLITKLSHNGQAILCTIHQPSAMLFQRFDRLLLLAKGGQTIYFGDIGEESKTLTGYFESKGAQPCGKEENPAEWMLRVIGAAPGATTDQDWFQNWRQSKEYAEVQRTLDDMQDRLSKIPISTDHEHLESFATPLWYQVQVCTRRVFEQYWRTPSYIYSKTLLVTASSLFIGFSFWRAGTSLQGLQNQMFSFFMLLTIFGNLVNQIMPQFVTQRSLYEARERPSKAYSWQAFLFANIIVELPWNSLMAVISFFSFYYPIGMQRNASWTNTVHSRGILMFLLIWAFYLFTSTFCNMIIAGIETAENGGNIATLLFSLTLIFCGVLATPTALPGFWIFMYRVSPFTYLVSAVLSTGLANAPVKCSKIELVPLQPPSGMTCGQYLGPYIDMAGGYVTDPTATRNCEFCSASSTNAFLTQLSINYADRWRNFGLMWVYIIFNVFGAVFLYWLLRVPKNKNWLPRVPSLNFGRKRTTAGDAGAGAGVAGTNVDEPDGRVPRSHDPSSPGFGVFPQAPSFRSPTRG